MNKASKAIRRSSIRLKSFSCGHSELNLIVSDMKDLRSAAKQFTNAQETVWKDLHKWASRERNEAIKESFNHLAELNRLWTEVQTEFVDQLNKFRYNFEMILEGEMIVDKLQERLSACEGRETKLKKELQKATKKNSSAEARQLENKIIDNRSSVKSTQTEITERTHENEAVKVIRLKEGLLKLSESYIDLAYKASVIFEGKRSIALGLPEIGTEPNRPMQDVRYRGSEMAKQKVTQVKEFIKRYKQVPQFNPGAPPPTHPAQAQVDRPPPYSTCNHQPFYPPTYQNTVAHANGWPPRHPSGVNSGYSNLAPPEEYDQDIVGAVGGVRM